MTNAVISPSLTATTTWLLFSSMAHGPRENLEHAQNAKFTSSSIELSRGLNSTMTNPIRFDFSPTKVYVIPFSWVSCKRTRTLASALTSASSVQGVHNKWAINWWVRIYLFLFILFGWKVSRMLWTLVQIGHTEGQLQNIYENALCPCLCHIRLWLHN